MQNPSDSPTPGEGPGGHNSEANLPVQRNLTPTQRRFLISVDLLVGGAIVIAAILAAQWLLDSKPSARKRKASERRAALVEVITVKSGPQIVRVEASGTVIPARQVALTTEVAGTVATRAVGFEPGAMVSETTELLTLDSKDYDIAVRQARSSVLKARAGLRLELGSQRLAKREFAKLGSELGANAELALRRPQLASAKADVSAARAALDKARLDVSRTVLKAPFDALVQSRLVDIGSRVGGGTPVGTLVGTQQWWIAVKVPADQLKWLTAGDKGTASTARIYDRQAWSDNAFREGYVARIAPELESQGRLAVVYVAVDDPLASAGQGPKLLLGSWVSVRLEGAELPAAVALDRFALRDGNNAWVLTEAGTLSVRELTVAFGSRDKVLVTGGLKSGDRVVTSDLPSVVDGMKARASGDESKAKAGDKSGAKRPGSRDKAQ